MSTFESRLPVPDDFAEPPTPADVERWLDADRAARAGRLERVRARLAANGLDAYFAVRRENVRYLTGFALGEGEEKVAGHSGQTLVGTDQIVVLADSRYTIQAKREAPGARVEAVLYDLPDRWAGFLRSLGARRVGVEAAVVSHALWQRLQAAATDVELVPIEGWVEEDRAIKEPAEIERIAAACAVADRALAALVPRIRAGVAERDLALELEWLIRTQGAEALAFNVACLAGANAALPHGAPGDRPVRAGEVLLFDFGAQVAGYRSDMTRTVFVGTPKADDLAIYDLVAGAQAASIAALEEAVVSGAQLPSGRAVDAAGRRVIEEAGHAEHFGHGTGHGIGLATHEAPSLSRQAPDAPLPSPTVFSIEPGVYLEGETGVRIEDLVAVDLAARRLERLTSFPKGILVVDA